MATRKEILTFLARNKKMFRTNYGIVKIGLFGSYARNEQTSDSDLDLIVEFESNTANLYDIKREFKDYISDKLNIEVDICREKYIKPIFKESILKEAVYVE